MKILVPYLRGPGRRAADTVIKFTGKCRDIHLCTTYFTYNRYQIFVQCVSEFGKDLAKNYRWNAPVNTTLDAQQTIDIRAIS